MSTILNNCNLCASDNEPILTSSSKSHGISREEDLYIGPIYPNNVTAESHSMQHVRISWSGTGSDHMDHYNIYRAGSDDIFQKVGQVPAIGDNLDSYQFEDTVQIPGLYRYAVTAVDINGLESQKSLEAIVTLGVDAAP